MHLRLAFLVFVPLWSFAAPDCGALAKLNLPDVTITSAQSVPAGDYTPNGGQKQTGLPEFCAVHGVIKPAPVSRIEFEVWMPVAAWNGRLEVAGNGGLAGTISYGPMANALRNGYASASTDTGHSAKEPATWLQDRERLIDYLYRGLHLTTLAAKSVVAGYYGQGAQHAYYLGCSTGGRQGLTEAQRFPTDFDGIVAGNAANFWTHQMMNEVWDGVATSSPETNLSEEALAMLNAATMAKCDRLDGLADGIIADNAACHFDPKTLECKAGQTTGCLTAAQVGAVEKLYSGPVSAKTGKKLYEGFYPGGELGWGKSGGMMVINRADTSGVSSSDWFRLAVMRNPSWEFRTFDFDRDTQRNDEMYAAMANATNPDLAEFKKLGHKLIYYHGANDPLIPAKNGIDYYESVVKAQKSEAATEQFFRAFLVPGMYHCAGGPGASGIGGNVPASKHDADHDIVESVARWVEKGQAPDQIIAARYVDNTPAKGVAFERPLCPYPLVARYNGSGDPNGASSFSCKK